MQRITDAVRADPVVEEVYRAKSEELGPGTYRFVAEIEFSGSKVVERYLDQGDGAKREQLHGAIIWLFGYLVIWLFGYFRMGNYTDGVFCLQVFSRRLWLRAPGVGTRVRWTRRCGCTVRRW
jgi:hypothetical protein